MLENGAESDASDPVRETIQRKERALRDALGRMQSTLVAYSGGVDSSYLLCVARQVLGDNVTTMTVESAVCPRHELEAAREYAKRIGARHEVIPVDLLADETFRANPADRCYTCKGIIFRRLLEEAKRRGIRHVIDGTNADDASDYRPGRRALDELGIRSPLAESGLTKAEIRGLARGAGIPGWDTPAAACLASRIPYGTPVDEDTLRRIDALETSLRSLGFRQVRARHHGDVARIELAPEDIQAASSESTRDAILRAAKEAGYTYAAVDLQGYRTGSLNETLDDDARGPDRAGK